MKRFFYFLAILNFYASFAQSPQRMSYQVVIRNSANQLLVNKQVGIRISILQGAVNGNAVYVETQTPTTNANGLATLEIGIGTVVSGTFSDIPWSSGTFFLKSETDPTGGSNYTIVGTSQLLSVPYALYADKSGPKGEKKGDMQYWDGVKWVTIPVGSDGQQLTLCNGVPAWGSCTPYTSVPKITNVSFSSAVLESKITSGGGTIKDRGFCYSTSPNPTVSNTSISLGNSTTTGSFSTTVQNLLANTTYYVRAYAINENGTGYSLETSFTTNSSYSIGQNFGGGIIFYLDSTGQHGLIVHPNDLNTIYYAPFGCNGKSIKTDTKLGSGMANTIAIVNSCTDSSSARYCFNLVKNGYNDWFLPSIDELQILYKNKDIVGSFTNSNAAYLSSSQIDANNVWVQLFNSKGESLSYAKSFTNPLRPVRAF